MARNMCVRVVMYRCTGRGTKEPCKHAVIIPGWGCHYYDCSDDWCNSPDAIAECEADAKGAV